MSAAEPNPRALTCKSWQTWECADQITEEMRYTRGLMDDTRFQALLHDYEDA